MINARDIADLSLVSLRTEIEPHPLVDELQCIGLLVIYGRADHPNRHHLVEKVVPARVGHRADPERKRVAGIDDAVFFQFLDRKRDLIVFDVRIVLLDERICFGIVAVEIVVPADRRRVDEALHQIRIVFDDVSAGTIRVE